MYGESLRSDARGEGEEEGEKWKEEEEGREEGEREEEEMGGEGVEVCKGVQDVKIEQTSVMDELK